MQNYNIFANYENRLRSTAQKSTTLAKFCNKKRAKHSRFLHCNFHSVVSQLHARGQNLRRLAVKSHLVTHVYEQSPPWLHSLYHGKCLAQRHVRHVWLQSQRVDYQRVDSFNPPDCRIVDRLCIGYICYLAYAKAHNGKLVVPHR